MTNGNGVDGAPDLAAIARGIIDANAYMTLATADGDGRPWVSPVWFAHRDHREFLWVSRPEARHSRNLSARSQVALVIFDSTVPPGAAEAVYAEGIAEALTGPDREQGIEAYSRRSGASGIRPWGLQDVTTPSPHRLYRATAGEHFVLDAHDQRLSVAL
jgi:nitroimidazol reductase NimA-like FMN-containing flavoprotein (pyridoxamine 5'-phosphate oxidase superfamily)